MRHALALALTLPVLLTVTACEKADASISPDDATAAEPAATETTPAPAEPTEEEKAAAERAKLETQIAARLAELEANAAEESKRWTPELKASVQKLSDTKWKSTKAALKKILASPHRRDGNAERDAFRHPAETLAFFGLKPNMKVFEIGQGAGWYTEILAPLLAKQGTLYLAGFEVEEGDEDPIAKFSARSTELFITQSGNLYEHVKTVPQAGRDQPPNLGEAGALDMVLVFRMMHNLHRSESWDRVMPAIHAGLKDGGVLAVVQHRAKDDANPDESAGTGYMPEPFIIEKVESYGFKLEKKSDINANAKDTKDHAKGVWTLPPVLQLGDEDREKYTAIGESDRSTLKFVKVAK